MFSILIKYADDSNIISPVFHINGNIVDISEVYVKTFLDWSQANSMSSNASKCKEITFTKKGNSNIVHYSPVFDIPQCKQLKILGVTFQSDSRVNYHIKDTLSAVNKALYIIRSLRKEGYDQNEVDHLFSAIVMPKLSYALTVYGASKAELTTVQCFLSRCFKRRYISKHINILDLLKEFDYRLHKKMKSMNNHPLEAIAPKVQTSKYSYLIRPRINHS